MGIFRSRKTRQVSTEPLPAWDDTRWRSHLRANALGTDHHSGIYTEMISADRKESARLFKNEDDTRARGFAESSLRNKRIVAALTALSPLCNALYQRSEPLAGYTSLVQIPEPARSGIVTIVFAAGRLQLTYLNETVSFLREQFGSVHIDAVQSSQGELIALVNQTVFDSLSPTPPDRADVDAELASSVKEYFGTAMQQQQQQQGADSTTPVSGGGGSRSANRMAAGTPVLSAHSSDLGGPQSPQFSSPPMPALPAISATTTAASRPLPHPSQQHSDIDTGRTTPPPPPQAQAQAQVHSPTTAHMPVAPSPPTSAPSLPTAVASIGSSLAANTGGLHQRALATPSPPRQRSFPASPSSVYQDAVQTPPVSRRIRTVRAADVGVTPGAPPGVEGGEDVVDARGLHAEVQTHAKGSGGGVTAGEVRKGLQRAVAASVGRVGGSGGSGGGGGGVSAGSRRASVVEDSDEWLVKRYNDLCEALSI